MFRRTSKSVKEQMDKMRLPAVVRECRRWSDAMRRSTWPDSKKLEIVMNQLPLMTVWCHLTTLKVYGLCDCPRKKTPETFAGVVEGVLGQSAGSLTHVALDSNWIGPDGVRRLAGVLTKCTTLRYLRLSANLYAMRPASAGALAGELAHCRALNHLDLIGGISQTFLLELKFKC